MQPPSTSAETFSLSSLSWTLRNQNRSIVIPVCSEIHTHLNLSRAEIITEPLSGVNNFTQQWFFFGQLDVYCQHFPLHFHA
ncbi:hypothetical protein K439DRAFT_1540178 [Ramaria rubella]|nr:hypothetical protein K439DRAFT_1540178 [Ramaria rubella]